MTFYQFLAKLRDPSQTKVSWSPTRQDLVGFKVADIALIAEELKANPRITSFSLSGVKLGDEGAAMLTAALKTNTTLRELSLCNCDIGEQGATSLAQLITEHPCIEMLSLNANPFGSNGVQTLIKALESNPKVTRLEFVNIPIDNHNAINIAQLLRQNAALLVLDMGYNELTVAGVQAIAEALTENRTLKVLHLPHQSFGDRGAASMANMLSRNQGLLALDLRFTEITDVGEQLLATALESNMTLAELDLSPVIADTPALNKIAVLNARNTMLAMVNHTEKFFEGGVSRQTASLVKAAPTAPPTDFFDVTTLAECLLGTCEIEDTELALDEFKEPRNSWFALIVLFHLQCIDRECDTNGPEQIDAFVTAALKALAQIDPASSAYKKACGFVGDYFYLRAISTDVQEDSLAFYQSALNFFEKAGDGHEMKIGVAKEALQTAKAQRATSSSTQPMGHVFNVPATIAFNGKALAQDIQDTAQVAIVHAEKYKLFAIIKSLMKTAKTTAATSSFYEKNPLNAALDALKSFVEELGAQPPSEQQLGLLEEQGVLNEFFHKRFGSNLTEAITYNVRDFVAALAIEKAEAEQTVPTN